MTASIPVAGRERPVYTRVEVVGLLLAAAAPLLMLAAGALAGMDLGEELVFFGIAVAIPLVGAALVWRFGTWSKVVGIVVALLAAAAMFWTVFGLAYPASFADFIPGILLPLGVLLAVAGGVAAVVQSRRGHLEAAATATERRILIVVAALIAIGVVGSALATALSRSGVAEAAAVETEMKNMAFSSEVVTVPAGEATAVKVHNADAFVHTFTVPALGIDETVLPGSTKMIEVEAAAGEYTLYCLPHANANDPNPETAGMAARLVAQ